MDTQTSPTKLHLYPKLPLLEKAPSVSKKGMVGRDIPYAMSLHPAPIGLKLPADQALPNQVLQWEASTFLFFFLSDRASLCRPGCPETLSVDHTGL